ncbi:MAG: glycosyltransferase family 2 protein [Firmicutes bacterium]|nr:glycosyltransferase family 2 protein [Bacillota bacterium]
MEKELVSVIVPSYNSEKTIRLCLEAIYKQDYKNYEVIVVDDCSKDNSRKIIEEFPCKLLTTPCNSKVAAVRNLGVKHAAGNILFFVDSDVKLFPNAITNLVKELQKSPEIGCVCGMYDKTPLIRDSIFEEYRSLQNHYWQISSEGFVTPGNFALGAIRKDVFNEIGEFNSKLTQSEEVEYGHRLNKKYKLLYTSKVMGQHDHDDKLTVIMRKLYERARQRIPLYFKRRKFMKGFETRSRAFGILFAFSCTGSLLLGLIDVTFLIVSALFFVGFLLTDFGQYLFVMKERKLIFTLFFIMVHYVVSVSASLGLIKGIIDWIFKKNFRENYELV